MADGIDVPKERNLGKSACSNEFRLDQRHPVSINN